MFVRVNLAIFKNYGVKMSLNVANGSKVINKYTKIVLKVIVFL